MGFFDSKQTVDKTVREISYMNYDYRNDMSKYDFQPYIDKFKDEEFLSEILFKFAREGVDFSIHMNFITNMFTSICINRNPAEEKRIYRSLIDMYLEKPELFICENNFDKICNSFDDKRIVLEYFRFLTQNENLKENDNVKNLSAVIDYVINARQYYVDDRALLSSAIKLVKTLDPVVLKYGEKEEVERLIAVKLEEDKKSNGIYNIDLAQLAEMDRKLDIIVSSSGLLETLIQTAEKQIEILRSETNNSKTEINQAKIKELADMQKKANKILKDFNASYLELLTQQRSSLTDERDSIMAEINRVVEKKKTELLSIADGVGKRITLELGRVNTATNESVKTLREFVENNEGVRQILSEAKTNEEFLGRLAQVEQLANQAGIGMIPTTIIPDGSEVVQGENNEQIAGAKRIVTPGQQLVIPNIIIPSSEERIIDPKINYYFDRRIPFADRFAQLMELKQKDIEENDAIYHEKFDDVLKLIIENQKPPYMYGPSGCGKTYMIEEQIAKLLGMHVLTNGYVLYEQDIIGYTNSATGAYVPSNFHRCYKFGDMIFLDELDNGIANATVVLNRFMGNNNKGYTFPDGINIERHPNFRIVAAGNTKGNGKTLAYNTRQKMDESVMQRMTPIEVDYDNRIEMRILKDYPAWYNFAVNFRKAIEQIPSDSGEEVNTMGTFTTRDAETVKLYLDDKCFNDSQIMDYEIIETKDPDYLSKIAQKMSDLDDEGEFNKGGRKLLELFHQRLEDKKEKAKCKRR